MIISIGEQIKEVEREIALRVNVYPRWVLQGKMRGADADMHIARMRAALETLRNVERQNVQ